MVNDMAMSDEARLLMEIKEQLVAISTKLEDIKDGLASDRGNLWKVLTITIIGAFALVGIKLVLP